MNKLILAILLLICGTSWAQNNRALSWIEFGVEKKIIKKLKGNIEMQYRGRDEFFSKSRFLFSPSLSYKLPGPFVAKALWRNTYDFRKQYAKNRWATFFYYKNNDLKRIDISNRLGYQVEYDPIDGPEKLLRNKLSATKNFKNWKFDPVLALEGFYIFHFTGNYFEKLRLSLGFERKIGKKGDGLIKRQSISFHAKREWFIQDATKPNRYILNVGYNIKI